MKGTCLHTAGITFVLMLALNLAGPSALAADPVCGELLYSDTQLTGNLDCSALDSDGLGIAADDVTLDLNGYTIFGGSEFTGIAATGVTGVTVINGAITGFRFGFYVTEAKAFTIDHLVFSDQTQDAIVVTDSKVIGIFDVQVDVPEAGGSGIVFYDVDQASVSGATVHGGGFGVLSVGTAQATKNLSVRNSTFAGIRNEGVGIRIANSDNATVQGNTIVGSDYANGCYSGIDVFEFGPGKSVRILGNIITGCGFGIFAFSDPPSPGIDIQGNRLFANGDGILLVGLQDSRIMHNRSQLNSALGIALFDGSTGNTVKHNVASGNGVGDMVHGTDSTPNTWFGNTCATSEGDDIDCP
jgi:parallel beta-helix repeat protein